MSTLTNARMETAAKKGDVVDYTRFRLGGQIVRCPRCGEKGKIQRFLGKNVGRVNIQHRKQQTGWCWQPPSQVIGNPPSATPDDCFFGREEAARLGLAAGGAR